LNGYGVDNRTICRKPHQVFGEVLKDIEELLKNS